MLDKHKGEVAYMLSKYKYVAVWIDSTPMFAFDRNTPRAEIEMLFNRFIGDEDCWMDGTNSCEEL